MAADGAPTPLRPRGGGKGGAAPPLSAAPKTGISNRETSVLQPPAKPAIMMAATQTLPEDRSRWLNVVRKPLHREPLI